MALLVKVYVNVFSIMKDDVVTRNAVALQHY